MEQEKRRVLVPSVVGRFQCKGAACRYNCCRDWRITMDKAEYHQWKKHGILPKGKQESGKVRLCPEKRRTNSAYAEMVLTKGGVCPYLDQDGLCQIQREYGVKEMTRTCRIFPRKAHSYFDQVECSLSPGCECVLELLLEEKEGLLLEEGKPQSFEAYGSRYGIQDRRRHPVLKSYYDIQTLCLAALQAEGMRLENRLLLLGMGLEKVEGFYREGDGSTQAAAYVGQFLEALEQPETADILGTFPEKRPLAVYNSILSAVKTIGFSDTFREQILGRAGREIEKKKAEQAEEPELSYYRECRERFEKWNAGKEYFLENVMVMYLLSSNIPFQDLEKSIWENYLYLVWVYVMMKGGLILALEEDSTDEDMIDFLVVLFRKLGHSKDRFHKIINAYRAEGDTLAHVAILLRCL